MPGRLYSLVLPATGGVRWRSLVVAGDADGLANAVTATLDLYRRPAFCYSQFCRSYSTSVDGGWCSVWRRGHAARLQKEGRDFVA